MKEGFFCFHQHFLNIFFVHECYKHFPVIISQWMSFYLFGKIKLLNYLTKNWLECIYSNILGGHSKYGWHFCTEFSRTPLFSMENLKTWHQPPTLPTLLTLLSTFEVSSIFLRQLKSRNWLKLKIKPQWANLPCLNRRNTLYIFTTFYSTWPHSIQHYLKDTLDFLNSLNSLDN